MTALRPPSPAPAGSRRWASPLELRRTAAGLQLRIRWLSLLGLLAVLGTVGWVGTAAGVFVWVKYWRGFTTARFVDIVLPQRWKGYAVARGNFYIEQAKTELQQRKWGEAIYHLRVGVGANPANTDGRLILAQCFVLFDRVELARQALLDGLAYNREKTDYLRALLGFLLRYQDDAEVVRLGRLLLPAQPAPTERNQLVALAVAEAHFFRGQFPAALEKIRDYELLRTKDGQLLQAQIDWDGGRSEAAIGRIAARLNEAPGDDDYYNQLATYYRQLGRTEALERAALLRELANPNNVAARLESLRLQQPKTDPAGFARRVDRFLADFGGNANALIELGNLALETANVPLSRRVFDHCLASGFDAGAPAVLMAETLVAAGDPRAALGFLQELNRTSPEWFPRYRGILSGIQAVACYALGQRTDGEFYLTHFLGQPNIRSEPVFGSFLGRPGGRSGFLVGLARRLDALGAKEEAWRILVVAEQGDPRHQPALTALVELDLQLGRTDELAVNLRRLLSMRRPSPALLRTVQTALNGDRYLFSPERDDLLEAIRTALAADPVAARGGPPPPSS